jgi:hypothetical protein
VQRGLPREAGQQECDTCENHRRATRTTTEQPQASVDILIYAGSPLHCSDCQQHTANYWLAPPAWHGADWCQPTAGDVLLTVVVVMIDCRTAKP